MKTPVSPFSRRIRAIGALTVSLAAPLLAFVASTQAQTSSPAPAESDPSSVVKLDPFTVSSDANVGYGAQQSSSSSRLNLRYIDVPQTVNVVTAEFLADAFIFDSREFTQYVSGISPRTNTHQPETFFIRGLQTTTSYVDGFLATTAVNRDAGLYNRIEYVKGPASAAIGRGEAGGLVNFIQKKPTGKRRVNVRATVGTDEFYRADLDMEGVLMGGGKLNYRLPLYYESNNNPRGGDLMHTEKKGIGPTLTWRPFAQTEVNFTSAFFKHRTPGSVGSAHWMRKDLVDMRVDQGGINPSVWYPGPNTPLPSESNVYTYPQNFRLAEVQEASLIVTHEFNEHLSLRQGFRGERITQTGQRFASPPGLGKSANFPSGYFVTLQFVRHYDYDEGLRSQTDLLYKFEFLGTSHTVLGGFDIYDISGSAQSGSRTGSGGQLQMDLYNPDTRSPSFFDPKTYVSLTNNTNRLDEGDGHGYYAQYSGSFLRDHIQVMAGWRKDKTHAGSLNLRNSQRTSENATTDTPRCSISYKPKDWLTVYYVHSEQADPPRIFSKYGAGIPLGGATLPAVSPYENEQLTGQVQATLNEYGAKGTFMGGRLTASAAYFEMSRDGFVQNEVFGVLGANGIGSIQYTRNYLADGEKAKGMEFEIFGRPTRNLTLTFGAVFQSGTNPRADKTIVPIDTLTDEYMLHGKYSFRDKNGNGLEITGGGKYWEGGWTISNGSRLTFTSDQYLLDAGANYFRRNGRYGVQARVNNIMNDLVYITENSQRPLRRCYIAFTAQY